MIEDPADQGHHNVRSNQTVCGGNQVKCLNQHSLTCKANRHENNTSYLNKTEKNIRKLNKMLTLTKPIIIAYCLSVHYFVLTNQVDAQFSFEYTNDGDERIAKEIFPHNL